MSKNKKSKDKKNFVPLSPEAYIRKKARALPIFECIINSDWKTSGMAEIIIARIHVNGNITIGLYLVDTYCLGVKDSFYRFNISKEEYNDLKNEFYSVLEVKKCDYTLAHNIIFGAVEFAEEYGFHPYKDFIKTTINILEKDDDHIELIDIELGLNGKPCIFVGPDDNYANAIARLEKTAGHGNFKIVYIDENGDPLYDEDDLESAEFDGDDIDEELKEAYSELEGLKNWTDKDWKDFRDGKNLLSEKALLTLIDIMFYSRYEEKEVEKTFKEMENLLDIEITSEPLNTFSESEEYYENEELSQQMEATHGVALEGNPKRAIQMTRQLIDQYPDNPILYSNLVVYYQMAKKTRKSEDLIIYLYQKFPDYLFAKIHYSFHLLKNGKVNEVATVLENKWTLPDLLPTRKTFHSSEVTAFFVLLISYFLKTNEILKADTLFKVLSQYGFDELLGSEILDELQIAKMLLFKDGMETRPDIISDDFLEKNYLKVVR